MKVDTLQQFLRSLLGPIQSSGAAQKVTNDLEQTCQALDPFKGQDFAQLAALLVQAEEYHRTGILPIPNGKASSRRPAATKVVDPAMLQQLAQKVRQLEEKAAGTEVSSEVLGAELDQLGLGKLSKPAALSLAKELGVRTDSKTTLAKAVDLIRRSVLDRKEALDSLKV